MVSGTSFRINENAGCGSFTGRRGGGRNRWRLLRENFAVLAATKCFPAAAEVVTRKAIIRTFLAQTGENPEAWIVGGSFCRWLCARMGRHC